jgi:anti-sigma factor RsiW
MSHKDPIELRDEVLGAYADGELDRDTARRVELALRAAPSARSRLDAIRRISMLVRGAVRVEPAASSAVARLVPSEPEPPRASQISWWFGIRWSAAWSFATAFGAGAGVAILAVFLWQSMPAGMQPTGSTWPQRALVLHERYLQALGEGRALPLDVRGATPRELGEGLASVLGARPAVPDLSTLGYRPQGARLLVTAEGAIVYVFYQSADRPSLGLTLGPADSSVSRRRPAWEHGGLRLVEWSDGLQRFGLSGAYSEAELRDLVASVSARLHTAALAPSL